PSPTPPRRPGSVMTKACLGQDSRRPAEGGPGELPSACAARGRSRLPATQRESTAVGTFAAPTRKNSAAMPGSGRVRKRSTAFTVTSLGETPVPPEVSTTSGNASNAGIAAPPPAAAPPDPVKSCSMTAGTSASATINASGVSIPRSRSHSTASTPERSSYSPAAALAAATTPRPVRPASLAATSCARPALVIDAPIPGLAAGLRQHPQARDLGVLIHGLDHVVHRQSRAAHRGERLHLHARDTAGLHRRNNPHRGFRLGDLLEVDSDLAQWQRVAQRNDLRGLLRTHDPGDTRHRQRIPLRQAGLVAVPILEDHGEDVLPGPQEALRRRGAGGL